MCLVMLRAFQAEITVHHKLNRDTVHTHNSITTLLAYNLLLHPILMVQAQAGHVRMPKGACILQRDDITCM